MVDCTRFPWAEAKPPVRVFAHAVPHTRHGHPRLLFENLNTKCGDASTDSEPAGGFVF
jgi:hypothetical protein